MLKLRLKRVGRRHDPSFRVVVVENTAPPKGKYLEAVGFYNARLKQLELNTERIKHWLSVGIQPTVTVHNLLVKEGVIDGAKISAHSTRARKKGEEAAAASAAETSAGEGAEKKEQAAETPKEDKEKDKKEEVIADGGEKEKAEEEPEKSSDEEKDKGEVLTDKAK